MIGTTEQWKQTFDYDRYGNRRFDEANTTTIAKNCTDGSGAVVCANDVPVVNPTINTANNRLDGYTFDNAGNTTVDAISRQFIYDAENKQIEVKDSQSTSIGKYYYDGDGKRVKKEVPGTGETTIFIYDASGKLVAEYSTVTNNNPQVSYLTSDHLGSPRINTDASGQVTARHDYQPFGEEIQRASYGNDDVREKFTSYERDNETDLDFAKARMHNYNLGRFTSPDPLYFQVTMVMDPQFFNLYSYARNNPLRLVDPSGESVRVRGSNTIGSIHEMAGGQEEFDKYFIVEGDRVWLRDDVDLSGANEGVQNLAGLVGADELYLFYNGNDFGEIADLFEGATKENEKGETKLTSHGRDLKDRFRGNAYGNNGQLGYIVAVDGRPSSSAQPGSIEGVPIFAIVALNSDIPMIQTGIDMRPSGFGEGMVALSGQISGLGQTVSASSFFIHEGAEAQTFKRIGFRTSLGTDTYRSAHQEAMRIEERIREGIKLTGGFSGGIPSRGQ